MAMRLLLASSGCAPDEARPPSLAPQSCTNAQTALSWHHHRPMAPPPPQKASARLWRAVEKDLRKLHRRGLTNPRLDDLMTLVGVAQSLGGEPTDREAVINALARAIDACWGGVREEGPSIRDVMRLWFGLPALDDPAAPDCRALSSAERHREAWQYWQGEQRGEAASTFRTSKARTRYEAIAKKLVELQAAASEPAVAPSTAESPPDSPPRFRPETAGDERPILSDTSPLSALRLGRLAARAAASVRKHRALTALAAAVVLTLTSLAWQPWKTMGVSIPPFGAIVNAQTGVWSLHAPDTPAEFPIGIAEGNSEFRGCDLTIEHPCRYSRTVPPLIPRLGDTLEFTVRLNNGYDKAIPILRLTAFVDQIGELHKSSTTRTPAETLDVGLLITWPSAGEFGTGPVTTRRAKINSVFVYFNSPGHDLRYIPKTSTIHYDETHFFHYLPDGIFDSGITLQDLGEPTTCYPCDLKYMRFVSFQMRVVQTKHQALSG